MLWKSGWSIVSGAPRRVAVLAIFLTSLCGATASAVEYDFKYVDAFQGNYDLRECYLFDVNDQGQACGWATDLPSYSGFHWSAAADKTRIPFTLARGINDQGKVAGLNQVFDIAGGPIAIIGQVPGAVAAPVALDINNHDIVVGYAETCICSNSQHVLQIPFIWDPVGGSRSIPVAGAKELVQINNADVAVGNIRGGSPDGFVYDLQSGQVTRLGAFLPTNPYPWTEAADINDVGMVTGSHRSNDAQSFHGFVWTAANGATLLPHFGGNPLLDVRPAAINNAGAVVGRAEAADQVWHAFVWDATHGIRDLNALVTPPAGFILDRALAINSRGWIVGDGHFGPQWSSSQAFVLIPRDEVLAVTPIPSLEELRVRPNPTAGPAAIEYVLPAAGAARIAIFDVSGRRVAQLEEPERPAGAQVARWDGRDAMGRPVAPGAYLLRIELPGRTLTRTIAVVR
jgi:probable HAF family extracellular repeat protein